MSVDVGVQLKMNNADFLRGVGSSIAGWKALEKEVKGFNRQIIAHNKLVAGTRGEFDKLDKRLSHVSHTTRALSLNFYELRNAIRNVTTRAAITGFAAVAAAINSIVGASTAALASISNLGGALAIAGGAGLTAAFQGIAVSALGLNKVMKALTTSGKEHQTALSHLTPAARRFEKSLSPLRDLYREIQLLSQAGIFPGLESAVKRLTPLFKPLKQIVYDTAVNMGYLADRAAAMLGKRQGLFKKVLENNVKLIQHYGRSLENFGFGILDAWTAAIPLIDHVAGKVEDFSKDFMRAMSEWHKNGSLGEFFANFKESFDNWTSIIGSFATTFFNIWKSAQPAAHRLERDVKELFAHFADFTGKHQGEMQGFFIRALGPIKAFANLVGDTIKMVFRLGEQGQDTAIAFFNGIDKKVLPVIEELVTVLQKDFVGSIGNMLGAVLDFVHTSIPAIETMLKPLSYLAEGFAEILRTMTSLVNWGSTHFGKIGGVISTALSVAAITATWVALRVQVQSVLGLMGRGTSFVKTQAARPSQALIGGVASGSRKVGNAITNPILAGRRQQAAYDRSLRDNPNAYHSMSFGPGPLGGAARLRLAESKVPGYDYMGQRYPYGATSPSGIVRRPGQIRVVTMSVPDLDPRSRAQLRPGVSMRRGVPGFSQPPLTPMAIPMGSTPSRMRSTLKGGEGEAMFRKYRETMQKETRSGFMGGLKSMFGSSKGSAAIGTLGALTGNIALALAVPVGIAAVGALAKAMKDNRPAIVKEADRLATDVGFTPNQKPGFNPKAQMVQNPALKSITNQLNVAVKTNDIEKIRSLRTEVEKLGNSFSDVGKKNKVKELVSDLGTLAAQTSNALLSQVSPDFQKFAGSTKDSIDHVLDALSVLKNNITAKLPVAGREYKEAMASAFSQAAQAIQDGIDQGLINEAKGLKKIHQLLMKEYKELGFTPEQARHLSDPKNKTKDPTGKQGGSENPGGFAHGGFIGGKGRVGHDSIGMNVDGRQIVTAPGEYVGIFTRHQQRDFEQRSGMPMDKFFSRNKTPHYASKGGIWKLGERISKMEYAGAPYSVSENSHFGGVHPVHVKNSRHYMDEALDVNHDVPAGSEPAALDSLAAKLKGWHVLWRVANHFDHLHVDDATGDGGLVGQAAKTLKAPSSNMNGLVGGLIQGTLNQATSVANAALSAVVKQGGGDMELEGSVPKGGGGSSKNRQLARRMMKSFGWGSDQWDPLDKLGTKESNWSETALNKSSGAYGIGQFLGATKDAYAKWGATSKLPGRQINAMFHYIQDRYVNPSAAWAFHLAHNWYDAGGTPKPPPSSGNPLPPVNPDDAVTPNGKTKKKKKKKTRIAGGRPTVGAGIGPNQFKPKSKQPKPKPRRKIKELIGKKFAVKDPNFTDPITGEPLDISMYGPLAAISNIDGGIGRLGELLDAAVNTAGLTEEQAIVNLYDSEQFPDLTSYLKNVMGKDDKGVAEWIGNYGDSMDVVNQSGMNVQGTFTRGISQAVAELMAQLGFHTTAQPARDIFGILGGLQTEEGLAKSIPSRGAVAERVKRLAQVKKIFEANVDLRKKYRKKLNKMTSGNYTWQQAVDHNSDLITSWQRWKRDSINEPQADTDAANHEMDRLKDLNKELRRKKPKGRVYGSAEYSNTLNVYQGRGIENRMLVGDKDATEWSPINAGGFAGKLSNALSNWRSIDTERTSLLTQLPGQIETEKGNISALNANISEWTGTRVSPPPISRGGSGDASEISNLNQIQAMDNLRAALLGSTQFDVLKNFAQMFGMRMLGAYAHGGLVPETGMALVHKGEYITPSPDGPFRNGMNSNSSSNPNWLVELHMHGEADSLVKLVDSRVRRVAPEYVSRSTGRKTRRISASPGGVR